MRGRLSGACALPGLAFLSSIGKTYQEVLGLPGENRVVINFLQV